MAATMMRRIGQLSPNHASHWPTRVGFPTAVTGRRPVRCVICRWEGPAFGGRAHCESATCPRCGSVARDRFLFWCLLRVARPVRGTRILETSPRLDDRYRAAMGRWFDYRCSDFNGNAHRTSLHLDLQDIDLPAGDVEVVMSAHVLEHVPETDRALAELRRILAPGGRLLLQVPVLQGATAPPTTPEFHEDDAPVFWRFGWDLTGRLRAAGFAVRTLVTGPLHDAVDCGDTGWPGWAGRRAPEFDVASILAGARSADLEVVADAAQAAAIGADPGYMFVTWSCRRLD